MSRALDIGQNRLDRLPRAGRSHVYGRSVSRPHRFDRRIHDTRLGAVLDWPCGCRQKCPRASMLVTRFRPEGSLLERAIPLAIADHMRTRVNLSRKHPANGC